MNSQQGLIDIRDHLRLSLTEAKSEFLINVHQRHVHGVLNTVVCKFQSRGLIATNVFGVLISLCAEDLFEVR